MAGRIIIDDSPDASPHVVSRADGLYLVTPPLVEAAERWGVIAVLRDIESEVPAIRGLIDILLHVIGPPYG